MEPGSEIPAGFFNVNKKQHILYLIWIISGVGMQHIRQHSNHRYHNIIRQQASQQDKGFTLVEILIVVIILGILASILIPQFSSATEEARDNMLKEDLRNIRTQMSIYTLQHKDIPPGLDASFSPDAELFNDHLTGFSDINGNTSEERTNQFCFGPYLSAIPENPINHLKTITILDEVPEEFDGTSGWIYVPATLTFIADLEGNGIDGTPYSKY